jgi:hypothetical protein
MRQICYGCASLLILSVLIGSGLPCAAAAQEGQIEVPLDTVKAIVTSEGQIIYFTSRPQPPVPTESDLGSSFEEAIKKNAGIQEFMKDNPQAYLAAGKGNVGYAMTADKLKQGIFKPEPVLTGYYGGYTPTGNVTILDPVRVLATLASNMLRDAKRLACNPATRPNSVEATASFLTGISFAATWDVASLCK